MHEEEDSTAVAADVPGDLPEGTNTALPPEVRTAPRQEAAPPPPPFGTQSSTTADQENLPLVDRPTACCIVGGGICKIKTTPLLSTRRASGSWRRCDAASRGAAGLTAGR